MAPGGESGRQPGRFADIRYVGETDSTNADVATLARAGVPEGVVVVADYQRAGRGRRGRTWTAPPGSALLASVLLRPALAPASAPLVGLAAAVAAVEACEDAAGVTPSLKWPNDVVMEAGPAAGTRPVAAAAPAKLAGLLAESVAESDHLAAVVVGMGLNLRWAIVEPGGRSTTPRLHNARATAGAAYLEDLARRPVDRDDLLRAWLTRLDWWCTTLEARGGEQAVVAAYRRHCITLGQLVRVELADGAVQGRAVEVTAQGHLVVDTDAGPRRVAAGDVLHLRPDFRPF